MHLINFLSITLKLFYCNNQVLAQFLYTKTGPGINEEAFEFFSSSIRRGVSDDAIGRDFINLYDEKGEPCKFVGKITMGGAFSLGQEDKLRSLSRAMLAGEHLVVDHVNRIRCGIHMSSGNYAIDHITYDDHSSADWTTSIANYLVKKNVNIMLSGYSTGMTAPMAKIASDNERLLIAPGSSLSKLYVNRSTVFAMFPPSTNYMTTATRAMAEKDVGAPVKKIAVFWEAGPFFRSACGIIPDVAAEYGIEITSFQEISDNPNSTVLDEVANQLLDEQPDVIMTCFFSNVCSPWLTAMRRANLNPGAWISSGQCVGVSSVKAELGSDAKYLLGGATWDPSLDNIDNITKWSSEEFASRLGMELGEGDVPYHSASAASAISLLVQAIEESNSLDISVLTEYISSNSFMTIYGNISFDENGQNKAPGMLLQWDNNATVQIVYPPEVATGKLVYPMPTWLQRDCISLSRCESLGDTCGLDGRCICSNYWYVSAGLGENTRCVPKEQLNYIHRGLIIVGYVMVGIVTTMGLSALSWIYFNKEKTLVKASQPIFLCLIVFGTFVSTLSIIFMGYQTGYRGSDDIKGVDFACMAVPWLWSLGFSFIFSALFAKIWRIKKIVTYSTQMIRKTVPIKSVLYILFVMLSVSLIILISFQVISPLKWQRDIIVQIDGFAINSAGICVSEHGWWFWAALVALNVISLLIALILCYQTRHINEDFADSGYLLLVVMFLFQVLILTIPVAALVREEPNVFYFVRSISVFLQNSTVLFFIFVPKMIRTFKGEHDVRRTMFTDPRSRKGQGIPSLPDRLKRSAGVGMNRHNST